MFLLDFPSLVLTLVSLGAAFLAGASWPIRLRLADRISLQVGLVGTFIGLTQMLTALADPRAIAPALSVACLTLIYCVVIKLFLGVYLVAAATAESTEAGGYPLPAVLLLATLLLAAILMGSPLAVFLSVGAFFWVGLGIAGVVCANHLAGGTDPIAAIARFAPWLGLVILVASLIGLLQRLDDPRQLGPLMALGLLSHLYANLVSLFLQLLHPEATSQSGGSCVHSWLYMAGSLLGVALMFALMLISIG
jgi:hypothetical protein